VIHKGAIADLLGAQRGVRRNQIGLSSNVTDRQHRELAWELGTAFFSKIENGLIGTVLRRPAGRFVSLNSEVAARLAILYAR
jgi:hypothetical protein